jgi:hypothetical protein
MAPSGGNFGTRFGKLDTFGPVNRSRKIGCANFGTICNLVGLCQNSAHILRAES